MTSRMTSLTTLSTMVIWSSKPSASSCTHVSDVTSTSMNQLNTISSNIALTKTAEFPSSFGTFSMPSMGLLSIPLLSQNIWTSKGLGLMSPLRRLIMDISVSRPSFSTNSLYILTQEKVMYGGTRGTKCPPRCPFEFMREPPPVYQKETPKIES